MAMTHYEHGGQVSENWNTVFKSPSAEPGRQLLVSLLGAPLDRSVSLPESAAMPNVPSDPEVLRQALYHVHLPMLAEKGFITWKTEPLAASRGPKSDEVVVVFEALRAAAASIPDSVVIGRQRLEEEQQDSINPS